MSTIYILILCFLVPTQLPLAPTPIKDLFSLLPFIFLKVYIGIPRGFHIGTSVRYISFFNYLSYISVHIYCIYQPGIYGALIIYRALTRSSIVPGLHSTKYYKV
jgi:hypothetical protein